MKRSLLTIAALLFAVTATSAREIPLPKGALIVGAVLFLLFLAAQLVVLVVSFLPLYKFIANSRKYSSLQ